MLAFGSDRNLDDTVLGSLKGTRVFSFRTKHGDVVQVALTSNGLYLSSSAGSATATRTYTAGSPSIIEIDLPGGKETGLGLYGQLQVMPHLGNCGRMRLLIMTYIFTIRD